MPVSVVIPLYNKARWIKRALESVLRQTHAPTQIVVVDDGSTDGGADIAARVLDSRITIVRQTNAGPGAARNSGLGHATGDLIAFLDADDTWHERFLERSVALLSAHPKAVCVSSAYIEHPAAVSSIPMWRQRGLEDGVWRCTTAISPQLAVTLLAFMWTSATVARTQAVREWGGFYGKRRALYGEDAALFIKFLLNDAVVVNLEALGEYHREASELSVQRNGPRPVEAFLEDPDDVYAACPSQLKALLDDMMSLTAMKTACMLAYWGRWREGRRLLMRFCRKSAARRFPLFIPAFFGVSPMGSVTGAAWRSLKSLASV